MGAGNAKGPEHFRAPAQYSATPTGLEPATSAVTGRRANQLRYGANEELTSGSFENDENRCFLSRSRSNLEKHIVSNLSLPNQEPHLRINHIFKVGLPIEEARSSDNGCREILPVGRRRCPSEYPEKLEMSGSPEP